jgi:hypothetical protein
MITNGEHSAWGFSWDTRVLRDINRGPDPPRSGNLECETVQHGYGSRRTHTREKLRLQSTPKQLKTIDPTSFHLQYLIVGPRWEPDTNTDWPTDRRSYHDFDYVRRPNHNCTVVRSQHC